MNEHRRSRTLSVCRESVFLPTPLWLVKFQDHFGTTKAGKAWPLPARQTHQLQKFACSCDAAAIQIPIYYLSLRIISFIENSSVIEKILRHLKLWAPPERPPPLRSSTTLEYDAEFLELTLLV